MKTIQIISSITREKLKELLCDLYEHTLKDDHLFHFFFEPELIIRISSKQCLQKIKEFLVEQKIEFSEYEYPFTKKGFSEAQDGIVAQHLDLFLSVFHAHAVAAIIMNDDEYLNYLERVIHTALNTGFYSRQEEGKILLKLADLKLKKAD